MTTRSEAFKAAEEAARNKDGLTEKRWSIQHEMEHQGIVYDSRKGEPDVEKAYSRKYAGKPGADTVPRRGRQPSKDKQNDLVH